MLNLNDVLETINMIKQENLDIRTITMGISLFDCADEDPKRACEKIYNFFCERKVEAVFYFIYNQNATIFQNVIQIW